MVNSNSDQKLASLFCRREPIVPPEELELWLEWAGAKLLALRLPAAAPSGYRNYWPDYIDDVKSAYGYTNETMRAPNVRPEEVAIMDALLDMPSLIRDITLRRVVRLRLLVTPVRGKHVYSYVKIAKLLHTDERLAARLHRKALVEIGCRAPSAQVYRIRQFLAPYLEVMLTLPPS